MAEHSPRELDGEAMAAALNRHDVRYVVVGGYGAQLHGSPGVTYDLDITPERSTENFERLAEALSEMDARIRIAGDDDGVPLTFDGRSLEQQFPVMANLTTRFGNLDLTFSPAGPRGQPFTFSQLQERSVTITMPEPVPVASLDDIIASKESANRPKDRATLPLLYELRDQLRQRDQGGG